MDNNTTNQPFNQPVGQPADQPVNPPVAEQQPDTPVAPSPIPPQSPIQTAPITPSSPQPIATPGASQFNFSSKSLSIKNIVIAAVNVIGAICFFLPWVSTSFFGISISLNGAEIGEGYKALGIIAVILSVASAIFALLNINRKLNPTYRICISAANGLAAILVIIETILIMNDVGQVASVGFGLIIFIIATISAAVLPWTPIKDSQN